MPINRDSAADPPHTASVLRVKAAVLAKLGTGDTGTWPGSDGKRTANTTGT